MIILIGSEKGGVGKSTLATNFSVYLTLLGKDVILVDSDKQRTSSNWADDRRKSNLPIVESVSKYDNIRHTLKDLQKRYEYVIVDAQGRDSIELRTGLLSANICITPVQPSQADLDTIYKMVNITQTAQETNEELKTYSIISRAPNTSTEITEARQCLSNVKEIQLLNNVVYDRRIYRDALGTGKSVLEMENDKAIQELTLVCEEIFHENT
jgi:chromosome partitioning protein